MGILYESLMNMTEDDATQPAGAGPVKLYVLDSTGKPVEATLDQIKAAQTSSFSPAASDAAFNAANASAANAPRAYKNGTIGPGSTGDAVKALQKQLGIPETGTWDQKTRETVAAKQKELGVTQDGKWGPQSRAAFDAKNKENFAGSEHTPSQTVNAATQGKSERDPLAALQNNTGTANAQAPGPAPEGTVLKAADIPWDTYDKNYVGADLIKKNGKWETQRTPQWNGMGAKAADPAWIAQLEKIWASKNAGQGAGTSNQVAATKGPNGEPIITTTINGRTKTGYWTSTPGKGTKNFVEVPGAKVQEHTNVGFSQDQILARIVELARK